MPSLVMFECAHHRFTLDQRHERERREHVGERPVRHFMRDCRESLKVGVHLRPGRAADINHRARADSRRASDERRVGRGTGRRAIIASVTCEDTRCRTRKLAMKLLSSAAATGRSSRAPCAGRRLYAS